MNPSVFSQSIGQDDQSITAELDGLVNEETQPSLRFSPYQWVELTEPAKEAKAFTAEAVFANGQLDEGVDVVQMDMTFEHFGEKYSSAAISVNGFIALGVNANDLNTIRTLTGLNSYPKKMPSPQLPNNIIAPFWLDLDLSITEGYIYYRTFKPETNDRAFDHFIVQWEEAGIFHPPVKNKDNPIATFQAVLFSGGGILFQYKTIKAGDSRERFVNSPLMPPDPYSLSDFDFIRKFEDANEVGEHFNIGYEDSTGLKGTSWTSTITPSSALGNELIPEWASSTGSDNFLNFIDGRDRRNNAVTGRNSSGCFISHKKSLFDR